jgi:uncharacterized membrane protein
MLSLVCFVSVLLLLSSLNSLVVPDFSFNIFPYLCKIMIINNKKQKYLAQK